MVNHADSEDSLDKLIMLVFEEQEDHFSFPLTTQKHTREFVKLLYKKGFSYELLCAEIDEKTETFRNWRLGGGPDSIGFRMMRRINRPFQDAMLSDAEDDDDGKHLLNGTGSDTHTAGETENGGKDVPEKVDAAKQTISTSTEKVVSKEDEKVKLSVTADVKLGASSTGSDNSKKENTAKPESENKGIEPKHGEHKDDKKEERKKDQSGGMEKDPTKLPPGKLHDEVDTSASSVSEVCKTCSTPKSPDDTVIKKSSVAEVSKSVGHEPTLHQTQDKTHKELDKDHDKIGLKSDPAANLVKNSSDASDKGVEDRTKGKHSEVEKQKQHPELQEPKKLETKLTPLECANHDGDVTGKPQKVDNKDHKVDNKDLKIDNKTRLQRETEEQLAFLDKKFEKSLTSAESITKTAAELNKETKIESKKELVNKKSDELKTKTELKPESKLESQTKPGTESKTESKPESKPVRKTDMKNEQKTATESKIETKMESKTEAKIESKLGSRTETRIEPIVSATDHKEPLASSLKGPLPTSPTKLTASSVLPESTSTTKEVVIPPPQTEVVKPPPETEVVKPPVSESPFYKPLIATFKPEELEPLQSYDSDLDDTDSSEKVTRVRQNIASIKSSSPSDDPGYIYVFSDIPSGSGNVSGNSKFRVKIGTSRFPLKRLKQAMCYNPDIRMISAAPVASRKNALAESRLKLKSVLMRGKLDWYWGTLDSVLDVIASISNGPAVTL